MDYNLNKTEPEIYTQVGLYVLEHYNKRFKGKPLLAARKGDILFVTTGKNASPIVLSTKILN